MNCVIPGPNLKILGKAIHALSKIGEELYLEADVDLISLRTVNISTTVFAVVKFLPPFFTHYKINEAESEQMTNSQRGISCKMPMKALLGVFKSPNQMEKQVEVCKIELDNNPTKIVFKFRYKHDVSKTQNVWLLDGDESLQVAVLNDEIANRISASSMLYTQALANFQLSDGEVTFEVTPQKIVLRNYVEGEVTRLHHVRSQLSLSPSEFSAYKINKNTSITFSLRPFRAAIQFAENFNLGISLSFQESGKPAEIKITNNITFEASFMLATMNADGDTQSTMVTDSMASKQTTEHTDKQEDVLTVQEKNDLQNIHWDVFDSDKVEDEPLVIPDSPESPRSKKMKFLFNRCFEPTFNGALGTDEEIYAENSDPECENLLN